MLRNTTSALIKTNGSLNFTTGFSISLPDWQLGPGEARQIDVKALMAASDIGQFNGIMNLTVKHSGNAGELLVAAGSVDQTGSYSFEVPTEVVGPSGGKELPFWAVGEGYDTMISVWNSGAEAEDLVLTLHHGNGDGHYKVPIHLNANASTMVSVLELIDMQQPDTVGRCSPWTRTLVAQL